MSQPKLTWFDKAIWAMAEFSDGKTYYNVYVVKVGMATSLLLTVSMIYRLCWKTLQVVNLDPPDALWFSVPLLVLSYGLVHLTTHSAEDITTAGLPDRERWIYTALGFFICPISWVVWGLLLVWLETWSKW